MNKKDTELNTQINQIKQELANLEGTKEGELLTTFFEETLEMKGEIFYLYARHPSGQTREADYFIEKVNNLIRELGSNFHFINNDRIPNLSVAGLDMERRQLRMTIAAANAVSNTFMEIYALALTKGGFIKMCVFDDCGTYLYTSSIRNYHRCSACRTRETEGKNRFIKARDNGDYEEIERLAKEYPKDLFNHWDRGSEHRKHLYW